MPYLVSEVYREKPVDMSKIQIMDLCAGCGVIGLDFSYYFPDIQKIDFVEVQSVYRRHFDENLKISGREGRQFQFLEMNYEELLKPMYAGRYDLILCNPPYFSLDQGKQSPSDFKNRCRFFVDSTLEKLIDVINHCLSKKGQAFVLFRSLEEHDMDILSDVRRFARGKLQIDNLCMIRSAFCLRLQLRESE